MKLDLRLAAPALACWVAAGVLIAVPDCAPGAAPALWGAALLAVGVLVVARRPRWRTVWAALALSSAGAALVASIIAVSAPVRSPEVMRAAAHDHASVTATLVVWSMPVQAQSFGRPGSAGRERFRATLTAIELRSANTTASVPVSVPAVVFAAASARAGGEPQIGSTIRMRGTLRTTEPGDAAAALFFGQGAAHPVAASPWWLAWANELRQQFSARASALPGDGGELLPGLAIGDTSAVSVELDTAMKASSLSHLTAVSGDSRANRGGSGSCKQVRASCSPARPQRRSWNGSITVGAPCRRADGRGADGLPVSPERHRHAVAPTRGMSCSGQRFTVSPRKVRVRCPPASLARTP